MMRLMTESTIIHRLLPIKGRRVDPFLFSGETLGLEQSLRQLKGNLMVN